MQEFTVCGYNIPQVSVDGESIPTEPERGMGADSLDSASGLANELKSSYGRVVIVQTTENGQKLVARFDEGKAVEAIGSARPTSG